MFCFQSIFSAQMELILLFCFQVSDAIFCHFRTTVNFIQPVISFQLLHFSVT